MRFSLIMATLGRKEEVALFLKRLSEQTYKNFELIIIDQNQDNRVYNLYIQYKSIIKIKYIQSNKKGLSLNRNIGLDICDGDIVAFPDDDCEYELDTLEKIFLFFKGNPDYVFHTCNTKDKSNHGTILKTFIKNKNVSIFNIMHTGISFTIFVYTNAIKQFRFDEQLGIGATYGSGEESDLLLYLLKNNRKGFYNANIYIYHPYKTDNTDRSFPYGNVFVDLYKKAVITYRYYILFPVFIFLLFKQAVMICFHSSEKNRIASIKGRLYGFIHYKNRL